MSWNPLDAWKRLVGKGAEQPSAAAPEAPTTAAATPATAAQGFKELAGRGLLPKFLRHWKNPAFLSQLKAAAARMQAEGVDLKDRAAVQAWLEKHKAEIESGKIEAPAAKPRTFVKTGPETGRNDPCPCGSGKKYKKCCGTKA